MCWARNTWDRHMSWTLRLSLMETLEMCHKVRSATKCLLALWWPKWFQVHKFRFIQVERFKVLLLISPFHPFYLFSDCLRCLTVCLSLYLSDCISAFLSLSILSVSLTTCRSATFSPSLLSVKHRSSIQVGNWLSIKIASIHSVTTIPLTLSLYQCLSVFHSLTGTDKLSISLCVCVCVCVCVCPFLSLCLSLSLSVFHCLSLSFTVSLFVSVSPCLSRSLSVSVCLWPSLSLSLPVTGSLSVCLSPL